MDKRQLLEFVNSLPDNLEVEPSEYTEISKQSDEWMPVGLTGIFGGVHTKSVRNKLTLNLSFTTNYYGEFRRTYENQYGEFHNVKIIK